MKENEDIKHKERAKGLLLLLIMFLIVVSETTSYKLHLKEMQKLDEIQQSIEQRNHLDYLYWQHLENCSFIHKDSIGVGYQGYLFSKHDRKYYK